MGALAHCGSKPSLLTLANPAALPLGFVISFFGGFDT
jgi:hypothetical protein